MSDTHFGHGNIIRFCNRPYSSVEEMNKDLIERFNAKSSRDTTVYHLGDVFFGDLDRWQEIFDKLIFKKLIVVKGNHDKNFEKWFLDKKPQNVDFVDHLVEKINGRYITLNHYPMLSWFNDCYGAWNLYGHHHNTLEKSIFKSMDVGVDTNNMNPYTFEEVDEIMSHKEIKKLF